MKFIKEIKNNSYVLNIITLMSGTAFSQGILIAATPILTRLFTPENFGILALYVAIVGTISLVSSWKYELAIILPDKEEDAKALVFLSILITVITTIFTFLIILLFKKSLITLTNKIDLFIWLVPLGILISGLLQIYIAWGTRTQQYNHIAKSKIIQSSTTVFGQLSLGIVKTTSLSLIVGNFIGVFSSLVYIITMTSKKHLIHLSQISKNKVVNNFSEFKNFPKFQSTSVLINSLSQHLPIFLLTLFYSPEIAGFYSLTHRALTTPVRLIGNSVRQVYYQRASKEYSENNSIRHLFNSSTIGLIKISVIPYLLIAIFAQSLFVFIFGQEWITSGIYAQLIIVYIFTLTINPPSVMTLQIFRMQRFSMLYEMILAIFRFLSIYCGFVIFHNHFVSIGLFSVTGMAFNLFLILFIYTKVKKQNPIPDKL